MLKASNLTYLWPNTLHPYVTPWRACVCDECGWAQDTARADISASTRGALQNMIKEEIPWTFQGARPCLPVWLSRCIYTSSKSCFLLLASDLLKITLLSHLQSPFWICYPVHSDQPLSSLSSYRTKWDTPAMADKIPPICFWRYNLKMINL